MQETAFSSAVGQPCPPDFMDLRYWVSTPTLGPGSIASGFVATHNTTTTPLAGLAILTPINAFDSTAMALRLPTHSFIPPPAEQVQQRRPWQGTITLTFMNTTQGTYQDVFVTAAETDGESRMDLWPRRLLVYLNARRVAHDDIKAWTKRYSPPVCALMPDKLPDPAANALNQENFANLSRMLLGNQMVALAPWGQESPPGAGMMIYPTSSSVSLLVGAVFLVGPFPEFATPQQSDRADPTSGQSSHHQYPYSSHSAGRYAAP